MVARATMEMGTAPHLTTTTTRMSNRRRSFSNCCSKYCR
jgi:hypothetical protein